MKINYEGDLYEGELYINNELVDSLDKLKNPSENHVYVEISKRYHFYETPWEKDDKFDLRILVEGKWFETWGWFINKTRKIVLKGKLIGV